MTSRLKRTTAMWILATAVSWGGPPAMFAGKGEQEQREDKQKPVTATSDRESFSEWGRSTRTIVPATNKGVWDGTWYYVSRDYTIAIWMKTEKGKPKAKLQYRSLSSHEGFITDWNGKAEYNYRDAVAKFSLDFKQRDADLIEGTWNWVLDIGKSARVEEGDYRIYRSGDGRFMVLEFENFERRIEKPGRDEIAQGDPSWTFKKASKRLVLWDELPF